MTGLVSDFELVSGIRRDAAISPCGLFRYTLTRHWGGGPSMAWVLLNPSTADAHVDDPTIRRCMGFARSWGFGGFTLANLYALRSTDPRGLWRADDAVGPLNDATLDHVLETHASVVVAWGVNAERVRVEAFMAMARARRRALLCLGTTKDGAPKHPLYLPASTIRVLWSPSSSDGCSHG